DARTGLPPVERVPTRWLWLAVALALALRFAGAAQSLCYDEIASLGTYVAHGPGVIAGNAFTTANHPLQSLLSWCCLPIGVEPWVRLPSILAGAVAVVGGWLIGRATHEGAAFATMMAFAMAILPAAVNAGSEARGYGLMIAASSLCTGLLLTATRHGGSWRWIAYACVLALGVWAHFVTALVGIGHAAIVLPMLRRKERRVEAVGTLLAVACGGLLAIALWSPALPDLLRARGQFTAHRGDEPSLLGPQGLLLLCQLVGMTPLPMRPTGVDGMRAILLGVSPACTLVLGAWVTARDRDIRRGVAFAGIGLPIAILLAWLGGSWLYARFLLFATPATALLLCAGIERASRRRVAAVVVLAILGPSFLMMDLFAGPRQPIREAVALVTQRRAPDDRVLGIGIADDVVQWYAMAYGVPIEPTGIGGEHLPETLARTDARWIVALYPNHRHANATSGAIDRLGFHRRPPQGLVGWLDGGEGTMEVWERATDRP
ncbi:MAG: hypothetical protein ACKPEA_05545, partial [Planctomycetota bacterium]